MWGRAGTAGVNIAAAMTGEITRDTRSKRRWLVVLVPALLLLLKGSTELGRVAEIWSGWTDIPSVLALTLGVLSLSAVVALLARRRLGWLVALSVLGWDLAGSLALWWAGHPNFIGMTALTLAAFLITSSDMRAMYDYEPRR